ncbi:hypothetical protein STBA_05160 [Streptomyces sp. MP131-18]|nr:hypothetical protein STBA_05160 [Streptomyces sp. MP131-18]
MGGAVLGEGVEIAVRGGVVGLARGAGEAGDGGEQHERPQGGVARQVVQMPGRVGLGPQDGVEPLGRQRQRGRVVQDACGVDHGGQRVGGGHGGEQRGDGVAVGDVGGLDADLGAQAAQFGGEFGGARRGGAAAADEQQVARAVRGDEVAGEERAEPAGPAGDEHGALRVDRRGRPGRRRCGPHQAGRAQHAVADGELRLRGGHGGRQRGGCFSGTFDVDQRHPVRVLGLDGPHQAPHGGGAEVGDVLARPRGDRARGDHDQPGVGERLPGQEVLDQAQDAPRRRVPPGVLVAPGLPHDDHVGPLDRGEVVPRLGPVLGRVRRPRGGDLLPPHLVQGVGRVPGGVAEPFPGHGPQHERLHVGDGRAGPVGEGEGKRVGAARADAGAEFGGARGVQGDAGPAERQPDRVLSGPGRRGEHQRVQDGVEERGVGGEAARRCVQCPGQPHLGAQVVARAPEAGQAAEGGPVGVAERGEPLVRVLDGLRSGVRGRPRGRLRPRGGGVRRLPVEQDAGGVPGPPAFAVVAAVRAGVDAERPAAARVGGADGHLHAGGPVGEQRQRRLDGQLAHVRGTEVVARGHGQFEEGGGRDQHGARDGVVGQPGVAGQGDAAGQNGLAAFREVDRGGEQRVVRRVEAEAARVGRGLLGEPEVLPPERVGGQLRGGRAGEEGGGVQGRTGRVGAGHAQGSGAGLGAALAQQRHGRGPGVGQGSLGQGGQHGVGAELDQNGDALAGEFLGGGAEAHRGADLTGPVAGRGQLLRGGDLAGHGGDQGNRGRVERDPGRGLAERLDDAVHVRGVEGVADRQPVGPAAPFAPGGGDLVDGGLVARDDHRTRAVDGRDGDGPLVARERGQDLLLVGLDGGHGAARPCRLHQPAAGGDERRGVAEGEHARHMGGGQFTDRVAGQQVRRHAVVLQHAEEGDLDGEQRRLGVRRLVQQRRRVAVPGREQHVAQRPFQRAVEGVEDVVERGGEHGVGRVQFPAHPRALGALAGEEESGPARGRAAADDIGRGAVRGALRDGTGGQGVESGQVAGEVVGEDHAAFLEDGARRAKGAPDGGGRGPVPEVGAQPRGLGAQCRLVAAGEHPGGRQSGPLAHGGRGGRGGGFGVRGVLDHDVCVGAADAERGDGGPPRPVRVRPGHGFGQQPYGAGGPGDVRRRLGDVQRPGQDAVAHRLDHLDDAADARGGLGVADVGLQRAEEHRSGRRPVAAVGGQHGLGLDGVAELRAGAVGLHGVHVGRVQPGVGECLADHAPLGEPAGRGKAVAGAVLVDGGAADDGEDLVPVAAGVREALHEEQADALGPAGAVGVRGEGLAAPVRCEPALPRELHEHAGGRHHGGAAGQRQVRLARPQGADRQVQGDQRGRAGGVRRHRRPEQAELVGDAPGHDARGAAGEDVALDARRRLGHPGPVLQGGAADEDAGAGAVQGPGHDPGPLDGFPGRFEQQPLLRVHAERLARRDAEERGVELARVVQESAVAHGALALPLRVRVVQVLVPAAVGGERADGVALPRDQPPQVLGRGHVARVAAGHADDGDRLGRIGRACLRLGTGVAPAEQFGGEVGGQRLGRRVVEDEAGGQAQPGGGGQGRAQLGGHHRGEAQFAERRPPLDPLPAGRFEHHGGQLVHQIGDGPLALGGRQPGQAGAQGTAGLPLRLRLRGGGGGRGAGGARRGARPLRQPVPLPLERVARQVGAAGTGALVQRGPVGLRAAHERGREGGDGRLRLRPVAAQHRNGRDGPRVEHGVGGERAEHGVGARLDEGGDAQALQVAHPVREADGAAQVPGPVVGRGQFSRRRPHARDVGDHRQVRLAVGEPGRDRAELRQHAVHVRRVEGVADGEVLHPAALRAEPGGDVRAGVRVSGDHGGARAVERGE